jgi:hypothetical protein
MTLEQVKMYHLLGLRVQFRSSPSKDPKVCLYNWRLAPAPTWSNDIDYRIHPEDLKNVYPNEHQ